MDKLTLMHIWNQTLIPVVLRRTGKGQRLRVRLPYADTNRQWRQNGRQTSPNWAADGKYWELPKAWFDDFVDRSLSQYTKVYIIQPLYVSSGARYLHRPEDLRRNSRYVLPSRYDADAPVARPVAATEKRKDRQTERLVAITIKYKMRTYSHCLAGTAGRGRAGVS
jgi:hypothetical protein